MGSYSALPTLVELKTQRVADIERRTAEVLARGYTYSGVTISLSAEQLLKYQTLSTVGLLSVPVTIEAADPLQEPLVLAALLSPSAFLSAVNGYVRSVYEGESALKSAVRAATTTAALEALVDTR